MTDTKPTLSERFVGCLLGLAVGDALGACFEGRTAEHIAQRYRSVDHLIHAPPEGELWYTDDTQMTIGVAETLVTCKCIDQTELCGRFADNYVPQRGYGRGARRVLEAMIEGEDHQQVAASQFPGGSFGNGAAMRVAPVGLMFRHDHPSLWDQARLSALPTHVHPLGVEGAQLLALAVATASNMTALNRDEFCGSLADACASIEYSGPLRRVPHVKSPKDLALFGSGIEATSSVVTAIASFSFTPNSYERTIGNAILLGGDTDTIAAMAGAISGAFLGRDAIPAHLLRNLENRHQGRSYIEDLAIRLLAVHTAIAS